MGKITCYVDGIPRQIEVDINYIHQPKLKLLKIAVGYVFVCMCAYRVCVSVRLCIQVVSLFMFAHCPVANNSKLLIQY